MGNTDEHITREREGQDRMGGEGAARGSGASGAGLRDLRCAARCGPQEVRVNVAGALEEVRVLVG